MSLRHSFIVALLLPSGLAAQATDIRSVHHQFQLELGNEHVTVSMRVSGLSRDRLTVRMPAWQPGSYRIMNFGRSVGNVTATDASGNNLQVKKDEGPTWSVTIAGHKDVTIHYQLPLQVGAGRRRSVQVPPKKKEQEKPTYAVYHEAYVFQGASTWMYVPGRRDVEQKVTFKLPEGWEVATVQQPFTAPNYDVLADSPFHIGRFQTLRFEVAGVPYRIVLSGPRTRKKHKEALLTHTQRIVRAHLALMGKAPFPDYTFLFARTPFGRPNSVGHSNSANITVPGIEGSTPRFNAPLDSLVSQAFFQLWNLKRLRPRSFDSPDYTKPNRTRYLWLCEGVSRYYGDLCCVRAGVWNEDRYWTQNLPTKINKLQHNPGRTKISVAEASWTLWDRSQPERAVLRQAPDYRNKGELLGLLLDVKIRDATDGKRSLDDVMRGLLKQCMDQNQGFADGDVRKWCEKTAGTSFEAFFKDYVDGTEELPFTEVLSKIGLIAKPVERRPAKPNKNDKYNKTSGRRRPPSWRVTFDEGASKRALRLRADMTRRIKD